MDPSTQHLVEQLCLLRIRVDVVCSILHEVYEPLKVLIHRVGTVLKVQELFCL
jgi:hypothetical protein